MLFVGLLAIAYEFTFYCTLTDFFSLCRERFNCLTLCVLYQFSYQTYVQISATSLKMILCISPFFFQDGNEAGFCLKIPLCFLLNVLVKQACPVLEN